MKICHPALALGIAFVLLVAGCGESSTDAEAGVEAQSARTVSVSLDGRVGPENVGIRLAHERGYFEDLGRDIWSGSPMGPSRPIPYVARENNDFGVTQLPQLLLAREQGLPVVAIGSLVPHATIAMIWLKKSGIRGIDDLKGKTIAFPGLPFQEDLLETVLKRAGLSPGDVEIKPAGYKLLPALLSGRADAIFGGSWNLQGAALEARGLEPVIKRASALGIPDYDETVLVTREELIAEEPDLVRDFMTGLSRGVAASLEEPEAAAKLIGETTEADPESTPETTKAEIAATLPLLSRTGRLDPARVEGLEGWMRKEGLIRQPVPVSEALTNQYLASP